MESVDERAGGGAGLVVTPPDWQRAKGVLTVAADLAVQERTLLVEAQFPSDPRLCAQVLSMLEVYDKVKDSLGPERTFALSVSPNSQPTTSTKEEVLRVGAEYHRYRVVRPLGTGGMGQVFLADDKRLGRSVALKSVIGRWLGSSGSRQCLLQEARAAAALTHPNVATLYDVIEDERYFLLVMEYVEGRTLAAVIAEGPIPVADALRLMIQICDAVAYAHDHGIIHCDLKPSNVQVTPDGTAKVLDFGLAHAKYDWSGLDVEASAPRGGLVGTPAYMPPERLLSGAVNVSGDIYSLGVTLFEMVTGRRPFDETSFAALTCAVLGTTAPTASSIVPGCPARVDDVIARAMAKDPNARYQTARELSADLQDVLRELDGESGGAASQAAPAARRYSRTLLATIGVVATIVGLTLAGFLTSTFYGVPLGLTMDFDGESPVWWPLWGFRSLVLPLAQIGFTLLIFAVANQLFRIIFTVSRPLRRWSDRIRAGKFIEWMLSIRTSTLAAVLLATQAVSLRLLWWRFGTVVEAFNNFLLQSGSLAALGPDFADEHKLYRRAFALLALFFGWGWYRLLKLKSRRETRTWVAGSLIMLTTFCLMVAPYRLFFHSKGERVSYQSQPCYLVGQKGDDGRLFCPQEDGPWIRLVKLNDPALKRSGTIETIFSPFQ